MNESNNFDAQGMAGSLRRGRRPTDGPDPAAGTTPTALGQTGGFSTQSQVERSRSHLTTAHTGHARLFPGLVFACLIQMLEWVGLRGLGLPQTARPAQPARFTPASTAHFVCAALLSWCTQPGRFSQYFSEGEPS